MGYPEIMSTIDPAFARELQLAREARNLGQLDQAWTHLERTHILGQTRLGLHLQAHSQMLGLAWFQRNAGEVVGQAIRLAATFLGHLTGRLPTGNTGRSNVSMFKPMDIPQDLRAVLEKK